MRHINKHTFLNSLGCPSYAWLGWNHPVKRTWTEGDRFRLDEGLEVGRRARDLYPDGVLVETRDIEEAVKHTGELLSDTSVDTIFEAAFTANGLVARADILRRNNAGWHLVEVKSGKSPGLGSEEECEETCDAGESEDAASVQDVSPSYVDDVAYTMMVARGAALEVSSASLLLIDSEYRLGRPVDCLFVEHNVTPSADKCAKAFLAVEDEVQITLRAQQCPEPQWVAGAGGCKGCMYFKSVCLGSELENPITELPHLQLSRFYELIDQGITEIADIPDQMLDEWPGKRSDTWRRVRDCVRSGEAWVSDELRAAIARVEWPAYFLDFEAVATAIPLYSDVAPYTQLPTQFSLHLWPDRTDPALSHVEYIADPATDSRRALAEQLISDLGSSGSIVVYDNFERGVLRGLQEEFPHLRAALEACEGRLVDLCEIVRKHYYHPGFRGKASIKSVLPVLAPECSYDDLPIADGQSAAAAFAGAARGRMSAARWSDTRQALLDYCRLDTLGMVKVLSNLMAVVG